MKPPTYFDHYRVADELRGVEGYEERLAIILRHVTANENYFHTNHALFEFDYTTEEVSRLRRDMDEDAQAVARGDLTPAHLSGTIQAWQVTVCEEFISRGRAERAAASAPSPAATAPDVEESEELPARESAPRREKAARKPAKPAADSKPRKTAPPKPDDGAQASLFG